MYRDSIKGMVVYANNQIIRSLRYSLRILLSSAYVHFSEIRASDSCKKLRFSITYLAIREVWLEAPLYLGHGIPKLVCFYFSWPIIIVDYSENSI